MNFNKTISIIKNYPPIFWLLIGGAFLNQAGNMAFVFLVPYLTLHMGFSIAQAAIAFATFGFSTLISGIIGGSLVDRLGPVRIMVSALFLTGATLLFFPWVKQYHSILFMCMLWGMGFGLFRPSVKTFVSFLTPVEFHRISFSIYRWALNLGMSIGPAVAGFIAMHSFPSIFVINALANIVTGIVFLIGFFPTPWFTYRPSTASTFEFSLKWLWQDARLRTVLMGLVLIEIVFVQHQSLLSLFLTEHLGFSLSFYGLLFTLNTVIIVFCELPLNVLTFHWTPRINLMLGSLLIAIGFTGLAFATVKWQVLLLAVFWTFGEMIMFPTATAYVSEISPEKNRGSYMSLLDATDHLGLCLGPWIGALIVGHFAMNSLWIACGLFGLTSILFFNLVIQKSPR